MATRKVGEAYIVVGARREKGEPKKTLSEMRSAIAKEKDFQVPLGVDASEFVRKVRRAIQDAERLVGEVEVETGLDTTLTRARLAHLTRPRFVTIFTRLNKASVAAVATAIARLSGARVAASYFDDLFRAIARLDKTLPIMAAVAAGVGGIAAAAVAAVGSAFSLGASLAQVAGAALVLPAILGGVVVGVAGLVMAFADLTKVLGDLGPAFAEVQDRLSANFWEKAEEPIRNLANRILPILNDRLADTGTVLGEMVGAVADVVSSSKNLGIIDSAFANINEAIGIAKTGVADFVDALITLGGVGSQYLPRLAEWFNTLGERFNDWISQAASDGRLHQWIENGITALKELGKIIGETAGILAGFSEAALRAGGPTLGDLADGLEKVNKAVNGPLWQGALTDVFEGANRAISNMGSGFRALGDAFTSTSKVIGDVLAKAGEAVSGFLELVAGVVSDPVFTDGLTGFFDGIIDGIDSVKSGMPGLAQIFGSFLQLAGDLARVIGPVLGKAFEVMGPIFEDLLRAITPVAEVLGGWLVSVLETLGPPLQKVIDAFADWVEDNPELAATLTLVLGAVGLVAGAIGSLASAVGPVVMSLLPLLVEGFTAAAPIIAGIVGIIGNVVGAFMFLTPIVGAVIGLFQAAAKKTSAYREAVAEFWDTVMGAAQPVIDYINSTVLPTLEVVWDTIKETFGKVAEAFGPLAAEIVTTMTLIMENMEPVVNFLVNVFGPAFMIAAGFVIGAFTVIGKVISVGLKIATGFFMVFNAFLRGDWSLLWTWISTFFSTAWERFTNLLKTGFWTVVTHIGVFVNRVVLWFQTLPARIGTWLLMLVQTVKMWFFNLYTTASNWVRNTINRVVLWFQTLPTRVTVWLITLVNTARLWFFNLYTTVSNWVRNTVNRVVEWFRTLPTRVLALVVDLYTYVVTWFNKMKFRAILYVMNLVNDVVRWFTNLKTRAQNKIQEMYNRVVNWFSNLRTTAVNYVKNMVSSIVNWFSNLGSNASNTVSRMVSTVINWFSNLWSTGVSYISRMVSSILSFFSSLGSRAVAYVRNMASRAVNAIRGFVGSMISAGRNLIQGLISGIKAKARSVANAARNVVSNAVNAAKDFLGIHSPSRVFMEIGEFTGEGYVQGLKRMAGEVSRATDDMLAAPRATVGGLNVDTLGRSTIPYRRSQERRMAGSGTVVGGMTVDGPLVALNGPVRMDSDDRVRQLAQELWTRAHKTDRAQGKVDLGGVVR